MDTSNLVQKIETTFSSINRSGTSLAQYWLIDQKGMAGTITDDEWEEAKIKRPDSKWQEVSEAEIEEYGGLLAHMDAVDFRYFLPAYMCYSLKHIYDTPAWEQEVIGSTVFNLLPDRKDSDLNLYKLEQLSLLNIEQQNIVIDFLEFVSKYADEFERPDALKALEYWYDQRNN